MSLFFGFSRKTRLAGALMLAAMMGLSGTAFGQGQAIDTSDSDLESSTSGNVAGDLIIIPNYVNADANIDVRLDNGDTVTVADDFFSSTTEATETTAGGYVVDLTLGLNSKLIVNNDDSDPEEANHIDGFMARGGTVTMEDNSTLTVSNGGGMRLEHNDFTMGDGATITIDGDGGFSFAYGSNVTLGDASITGDDFDIEGDSTLNLGVGAEVNLRDDFTIVDGVVKLAGSSITIDPGTPGKGYGFNIGDDDGLTSGRQALLQVSGTGNSLTGDGFFAIKSYGKVHLDPNSALTIKVHTVNPTGPTPADILDAAQKSGAFAIGAIQGLNDDYEEFENFGHDWDDYDPADGDLLAESGQGKGGFFRLGTDSTANIDGRAVFGAAGDGADSGVYLADGSTLAITGNAYFLDNSRLTLENTSATVTVGGQATIESGARLEIGSGNAGDVILTANSLADSTLFENLFYELEIVNNNEVRIKSLSSDGIVENLGQNGNYVISGALIINIISNSTGTAELQASLKRNMEQIGLTIIDGNSALAEIAMKQLIGEEALAVVSAAQISISQGNQALGQHFQALRGGSSPSAGAGDTENRLWVGSFGQWSSQDDKDKVYGYDYNSVGLMLGYDREVAALPGLTLGFNGSWNSGTVENNDGLAETDIDSFGLGLYGLYEFSGGFFIVGDLGYGHAENDSEIKLALGGKKSGDFDVDSFQAGLNLGYDFRFDNGAILTPSAGLRYTHIKQDGWRESIVSDPNNLAVANWFDDSTQNFLEFPINLKLAKTFETQGGATITPELRAGAVFTANDPESSLRMGFVGSNDSVTINGIDPGRSRFTAGAGIKAQLNDTVDLFAGYDLEAGSGYTGHSASLGLGFSF